MSTSACDITDYANDYYKSLVDTACSIIIELDTEGNLVFINNYALNFFGFSKAEVIGRSIVGTFVPEIESSGRDLDFLINDIVQHPEKYRVNENENVKKNGERVWFTWSNAPKFDLDGNYVGVVCVANDTTSRRKARDFVYAVGKEIASLLKMEEEVLELIYQSISKIVDTNNMFIALYDSRDKLLRFPIAVNNGVRENWPVRKLNFRGENRGLTELVIERKKPINSSDVLLLCEQEHIRPPIEPMPLSWLGVPMLTEHSVIGIISLQHDEKRYAYTPNDVEILQNIADQTAIAIRNSRLFKEVSDNQARIAEAQEVLTRVSIANDFTHKLNNLAGPIRVWNQMIERELQQGNCSPEKIARYSRKIGENADNVLNMAHKLKVLPPNEIIDIKRLVERISDNLRDRYEDKFTVFVTVHVSGGSNFHVYGSQMNIEDAIENIVNNAVEVSPDKGRVSIDLNTICDTEPFILISISDEGGGIPEAHLNDVFVAFYSTKGQGRGYGLWRSKNIIEAAGGSIECNNTKVGARFTVKLPAYQGTV